MFKPQIAVSLTNKKSSKTATDDTITETINKVDWERINTLAQETLKKAAVLAVLAYAGKKAIDTTSDITILAAQAHFND